MITRFFPKNKSFNTIKQEDVRAEGNVMHFNEGNSTVVKVKETLGDSSGIYTIKFAKSKDAYKEEGRERKNHKTHKARRNILRNMREKDRIITESKEETTYESNSGIINSQENQEV